MAQQMTFADMMKAQAVEDFKRFEARLYADADEQCGGLDYDELDHEVDCLRYHVEAADEIWGVPETLS